MYQFAGHLDMFFNEMEPEQKIATFAELGYNAVEFWCWWQYQIPEIAIALKRNNVTLAAVCTKFIPLTTPETRQDYLNGLLETIDVCDKLSCSTIISQIGNKLSGVSREQQKLSIINGLKAAVPILEASGKTLVIEPLNTLVDHKDYFLSHSKEAAEIIESVDSDSVKMLFDVYHQQVTEGNLINNINRFKHLIGYYHIADNPGRKQPGTGEINYRNVLLTIADTGYQEYIGLECFQSGDSYTVAKDILELYYSLAVNFSDTNT